MFALPLILVMVVLILLKLVVFVNELRTAGLPRVPVPSGFTKFSRLAIKIVMMTGVVVATITLFFFAAMVIVDNKEKVDVSNAWPVFGPFSNILVSLFMLIVFTIVHFDWLRRISEYDKSAFATVPAMITHVLPNQVEGAFLKVRIIYDSTKRIVTIWLMGLAIVFLGVSYVHGFRPEVKTTTNLLAQLLIGMAAWLWISLSMTFFFIQSKRRELGILDGTYTATGRSKLKTLYFTLVMLAGILLALACLCTNMYRVITTLTKSGLDGSIFSALIVAWAPLLFYVGLLMDVSLIHARNRDEDQSVCTRLSIPLCMGMEYRCVCSFVSNLSFLIIPSLA